MSVWRQGRRVGRTLYRDGQLVGLMDTPELAQLVCTSVNGLPSALSALDATRNALADQVANRSTVKHAQRAIAAADAARETLLAALVAMSAGLADAAATDGHAAGLKRIADAAIARAEDRP